MELAAVQMKCKKIIPAYPVWKLQMIPLIRKIKSSRSFNTSGSWDGGLLRSYMAAGEIRGYLILMISPLLPRYIS